jgi:tetratricopeptide (TPR) repeat protein
MGYILEGDLLMQLSRYDEASKAYALASNKTNSSRIVEKRYRAVKLNGDSSSARSLLSQWLEGHADDLRITMLLADDHVLSGENAPAVKLYRKVLDNQPNNIAALNNIALAYLAENDKQALKMADKANQLAPDDAAVADTFGWVLVHMGDVGKGTKLLARVAGQYRDNPEIQYHYAAALARSGQTAEAKRILGELLAAPQQDFNGLEEARKLFHSL